MKNQKFFFAVVAVLIVLGVFFFFFFVGTPRTFAKGVRVSGAADDVVLVANTVPQVGLVEGLGTVGDVKSQVIPVDDVDVPENVRVAKVVVESVAVNIGVRDIGVNDRTVELASGGIVLTV